MFLKYDFFWHLIPSSLSFLIDWYYFFTFLAIVCCQYSFPTRGMVFTFFVLYCTSSSKKGPLLFAYYSCILHKGVWIIFDKLGKIVSHKINTFSFLFFASIGIIPRRGGTYIFMMSCEQLCFKSKPMALKTDTVNYRRKKYACFANQAS